MNANLKGKKLLILGGIKPMIEVVKRCHELGIVTYVTDYLIDSPAKKVCDKSFMISCTDIDAVVDLIKKENIDGLYCGNNDMLLPYYAKICEKAGLFCYGSLDHFLLMTDKKRFKDLCRRSGVPTIEEYSSPEDIKEYPVLVKPVDSSGSRGISICHSKQELIIGIEKARNYSPTKQILIEKYMTGDEVVLYYYMQNGNPVFAGMCDRYVLKQASDVAQLPTAYIFPSKYIKNHINNTDKVIKKMLVSIGMTNGPLFLQAFIHNGIPYIYEPGYRTNGAREQYIIGASSGVSSVDLLINFALTGSEADYDISKKINPTMNGMIACKLSPLIGKGKIGKIEGIDCLKQFKEHIITVPNNNVGDEINDSNYGTLMQVAYRSFFISDSIDKLKKIISFAQSSITYYDDQGKSMMLKPFDVNILDNYLTGDKNG